ncbi:hypothetical protein ASN18_1329 [Candidatus Magnetominusculus xianensis]|uniref:Transposase n=1 Tax=Candidatus Magnetominusculus xianensis TaxID=1748249 RepID=A0ABR5SG82_9BACT|nr:hypothetical protein ASN18_1329 [Candidatus Magnetominusculus xianensis]
MLYGGEPPIAKLTWGLWHEPPHVHAMYGNRTHGKKTCLHESVSKVIHNSYPNNN